MAYGSGEEKLKKDDYCSEVLIKDYIFAFLSIAGIVNFAKDGNVQSIQVC